MRIAGYLLLVVGGAWIVLWLIYGWFERHGIYQALGDVRTETARNEADRRGREYQHQLHRILRRGLPLAAIVVAAGVALFILGN